MSEDDGPRSPDGSEPADDVGSEPVGDDRSVESRAVEPPTDGGDGAGPIRRVLAARSGALLVIRETAVSVGAVVAVGLLLFAISGVWPPMVAVESGSMEPHMQKGDLVFMTEPGRFAADAAVDGTGVVTRETAREGDHWKFGAPGSVIVYDDPGSGGPPVIHRAQFWVDEGENWYDRADPDHVRASDCAEMRNCPAPHAGFVTKGDANGQYDQVNGISRPVRPEWIVGIARVRIPYLGWVRLSVAGFVVDSGPAPVPGFQTGTDAAVDGPTVDGSRTHPEREASTARTTRANAPTAPNTRSPAPRVRAATAGTSSHATQ
jgi:signal peptidase